MHTLSESKSIFATEQRATVSGFIKNVAFLLGHPVVQFLDDVIHQVDYLIGQNRQMQVNCDCQGHNGTDTNRPVCVQVSISITF